MLRAASTAMFVLGFTVASDPTAQAFRFFEGLAARDVDTILRALRPPPVSPAERVRAIALLPAVGNLRPDRDERAKLATLQTVLVYHERAEVLAIRVIDVPQAAVALHQRAVLLISRPALRLVSATELQALVAHEIGHDYFWRDFEDTFTRSDKYGRQELELRCDGIAMLTLIALRFDPVTLTDGLRKVIGFNAAIGPTPHVDKYPPLRQRERFINAVRERYKALPQPVAPNRLEKIGGKVHDGVFRDNRVEWSIRSTAAPQFY